MKKETLLILFDHLKKNKLNILAGENNISNLESNFVIEFEIKTGSYRWW